MTYRFVIALGRVLFRVLALRVSLEGSEHVPRRGPAVLAANHVSFVDFLLVGLAGVDRGRRVRFLARHDLWDHWLAGFLLTRMGHIPVDREAPAHAYLLARAALRRGEVVGIFPEAGVSPSFTVRDLMPGAAALAAESGCPLVPVGVWGGQRLLSVDQPWRWQRGTPVSIRVAAPVRSAVGESVIDVTRRLGHRLHDLLDGLQRRPEQLPEAGAYAPWHPHHLDGHAPTLAQARLRTVMPRGAVRPTWGPYRDDAASARNLRVQA